MKDFIKLVYCRCGGHYLLFDVKNDPMEQHDLSHNLSWGEKRNELKELLFTHVSSTAPEVIENGEYIVIPEPKFPGDVNGHWFGFHYKDYSVDTFH